MFVPKLNKKNTRRIPSRVKWPENQSPQAACNTILQGYNSVVHAISPLANKKYHCVSDYALLPVFVMVPLVIVEYLSIGDAQMKYQDIFITVVFLVVMYLSLRFDHCLITDREFSRKSYFFWKTSIKVDEITEITFPPTWVVAPEARTLVVWSRSGQKITMTDMGYPRPVLANVLSTLPKLNPSNKIGRKGQITYNMMDRRTPLAAR